MWRMGRWRVRKSQFQDFCSRSDRSSSLCLFSRRVFQFNFRSGWKCKQTAIYARFSFLRYQCRVELFSFFLVASTIINCGVRIECGAPIVMTFVNFMFDLIYVPGFSIWLFWSFYLMSSNVVLFMSYLTLWIDEILFRVWSSERGN